MPQPCDPISGFERILCTFRACHVERWLVLCCWHRADMACCQGSREKAKRKLSGGGADHGALPELPQRTFWLFCWELVSLRSIPFVPVLFPDCSKGPFWNWSLVSFIFIMLLINKTPHSGLSVIDAYIPFPPLLWLTHIRMVKRGD